MSARTPGPWRVVANDNSGFWEIHDDAGWLCELESESTAKRIVEACNAYDTLRSENEALREALEYACTQIDMEAENYRDGADYQPHGKTLRAVAAKARTALAGKGGV